jgi:Ca-activated chloride channel family protein
MTALPIVLMTEEEVANFGRRDSGLGALECERGLLPLTAMNVNVKVAGVLASIELTQTFVNTTGGPIEATYIFPLPDRAAVHRFRMEVAGRVVEGVVDERGAAREQYDQAIAAGHRAAITEQERPDVFTLRVGNLMAGETATVVLSLVGPLAIDDGEVTLRFPLVVAPRYIPGAALGGPQAGLGTAADTDLVPDASRISPPVLLPGFPNPVRLSLRVAIEDHGIRDVASSLHAVTTTQRDAHIVELRPAERLDRDFILRWRLDDKDLRSTLVCADDADGKAGTFLLTFVPPSTAALSTKPRDVVFVIDRSGSMDGWKMVAARRAVARMIDTLTSRDRFAVIAFDDLVERIPGRDLATASDRKRFAAVEAVAKVEARGGTELDHPLRIALGMLAGGYDDRERVLVLVTDGQVGNEDHLLRESASGLRNVRVFTLGIDQAVNAGFLKRFASAGGGLCELVESEDRLDQVMAKVHRRIGTPVATELAVRSTNLELERASIAPHRLPDVYAGAPVVVLGRYRGKAPDAAAIELEGTSFGDPLKLAIHRTAGGAGDGWLAASWARAHIRELEDRYATGAHEVEADIVAVSKRFGVLSRFTAYLAIDRAEIANKGGKLKQIVQAVEEPAGWEMKTQSARAAALPPSSSPPQGGMLRQRMMPPQYMPTTPLGPPPAPGAPPPIRASVAPAPMAKKTLGRKALMVGGMGGAKSDDVGESSVAEEALGRMLESPPGALDDLEDAPAPQSTPAGNAYLTSLGQLARELEAQARGAADVAVIRRIRQRIAEWVEDLRSVSEQDALAEAVAQLVRRLSAALARGENIASETLAVATELTKLANGESPPPSKGRVAFWK